MTFRASRPPDSRDGTVEAELSGPSATGAAHNLRPVALAALTALLVSLCALMAYPLLPALTWAIALAILAWPLHRALAGRIPRPSLAAALSTGIVTAIIVAPCAFVAYEVAYEAAEMAERNQDDAAGGTIEEKAAETPVLGRAVRWLERVGINIGTLVRRAVRSYTVDVRDIAASSAQLAIQGLVAVFLLFFLFRDRSTLLGGLRDLLPLAREESDRVLRRAADSVHANLHATVITSVIDCAGFALLFWWFALPAPVLWTAVMFVLSLLPVLGAALVWLPAVAYMGAAGHWPAAASILAWGGLTFVAVDNALYARLAGDRMRMHPAPALVAFLGGVAVFGASGMVLGPAIFAVTMATFEVWKGRVAGANGPVGGPAPKGTR